MNYIKTIFTLLIFLLVTTTYSQTEFCNGWKEGFKEGYCYGTYGCTAPVTPPCPVPNIGNDNYKGGYNQGFVAGKNKKDGGASSTSNGGAYGQLKPIENNNIGQTVQDYIRNNRDNTETDVGYVHKYTKTEKFSFLKKNALNNHQFKLYQSCVDYYAEYKKYKRIDNRLEYAFGDSYWKLYQENKKKSNLKKAIKVLKISIEHGNQDAVKLLNEIESM